MRGSAVSTPETSVQIWTSSAPTARPTIVAVKSEPDRPSVVVLPSGARPMKPVTTGTPFTFLSDVPSALYAAGSGDARP